MSDLKKYQELLEKQHYEIVGRHSAVEVCGWTKKGLKAEGVCYKQKFYGIKSHRCVQMTPAYACDQKCSFCWRANEFFSGRMDKFDTPADDPDVIIDGSIAAQIKKLTGFGGNDKTIRERFKESSQPKHFAISLTGEPTLYPKLSELVHRLHERGISSFLVTNGLHPEVIEKLWKEGNLPTQLYVSLDAPTRELWKAIDIPLIDDYWERLNKTLELLAKLPSRRVIRMTMIRGMNDNHWDDWVALLKKVAGTKTRFPLMVEIKSYMWIGYSRKRLKQSNQFTHEEILEIARKLADKLGWKLLDDSPPSKVALIAERDFKERIMEFE